MDRFPRWGELLQLAPNGKTVNAIMADYVQTLGPLLGTLPDDCRRSLEGVLDVQAAAVALLRAELRFEGSDDARAFLHEVAYTFASAAVRITLLHERPGVDGT